MEMSNLFVWDFGDLDRNDVEPMRQTKPSILLDRELTFRDGEPVSEDIPMIEFLASPKTDFLDYQFNLDGLPLLSKRLRDLLDILGVDSIEYFPALVKTKRGKKITEDYMIGNVTKKIACFDWDNSVYDNSLREYGAAQDIAKLELTSLAYSGPALFRLSEAPRILLASGDIKNAIERNGISGVRLTPASTYSDL